MQEAISEEMMPRARNEWMGARWAMFRDIGRTSTSMRMGFAQLSRAPRRYSLVKNKCKGRHEGDYREVISLL